MNKSVRLQPGLYSEFLNMAIIDKRDNKSLNGLMKWRKIGLRKAITKIKRVDTL